MDSTSTCNTKLLKKVICRKYNSQNLSYLNHHLIKSNQIHSVKKLTMKKLYLISLQHKAATSETLKKYFESMFRDLALYSGNISLLFHFITNIDFSKLQCFQYKLLHNALNLNQKLFYFANIILHFSHFVILKAKRSFIFLFIVLKDYSVYGVQ